MPTGTAEAAGTAAGDATEQLEANYKLGMLAVTGDCLRLAGPIAGLHVLDVGTGCGAMTAALAGAGAVVTSIDINLRTLGRARNRLTHVGGDGASRRLIVADALRLPFPPGSFDLAFSVGSMHHMPDCAAVTKEMLRVLQPGGRLVIVDLNDDGLAAIRALNLRRGRQHQENSCRLENLRRIVHAEVGDVDQHDFEFAGILIADTPRLTFPRYATPIAAWASSCEEHKSRNE